MIFQGKTPFILTTLACTAIVIMSFILELGFDVRGCALCKYERGIFIFAALWSLYYSLIPNRPWRLGFIKFQEFKKVKWAGLLSLTLICFAGFSLSFYHVLIQQGVFPLPPFCAPPSIPLDLTTEQMREALLNTPFVPCNKVTWSLFGLSLAAYGALAFGALTVYNCIAFQRRSL